MSFTNTIRCMKKQASQPRNLKSAPEFIITELATPNFTQIKTILSEIGQENVELETNEIYCPRKSLDLSSIKNKKLELEKSIKDYTRPEKPSKPQPKKIIKAKIANKKLEK